MTPLTQVEQPNPARIFTVTVTWERLRISQHNGSASDQIGGGNLIPRRSGLLLSPVVGFGLALLFLLADLQTNSPMDETLRMVVSIACLYGAWVLLAFRLSYEWLLILIVTTVIYNPFGAPILNFKDAGFVDIIVLLPTLIVFIVVFERLSSEQKMHDDG